MALRHMEQIAGLVRVIYLSGNIKKTHTQRVHTHRLTATQQLNIYRVRVTHEQSRGVAGQGMGGAVTSFRQVVARVVWPAEFATAT